MNDRDPSEMTDAELDESYRKFHTSAINFEVEKVDRIKAIIDEPYVLTDHERGVLNERIKRREEKK